MISFIYNSGKCKLIYSDRKHTIDCLDTEQGGECLSIKGQKGRITKGHEKSFGGDGYVYYLLCNDGFRVYIYGKLIKLYSLKIVQYIVC